MLALLPTVSILAQEASSVDGNLAYLAVRSEPPGLEVFLDDSLLGTTPLDSVVVNLDELRQRVNSDGVSRHLLLVRSPDVKGSWFARDWSRKIVLAPGELAVYEADFPRHTVIESHPYGADILVDDVPAGNTPALLNLAGSTALLLSREGFDAHKVQITEESVESHFKVRLQRTTESPSIGAVQVLNEMSGKNLEKYRVGSLSLTLVAGVAAVYFKSRADEWHERYLQPAPPELRRLYYDKTRRYDAFSGVSFGVFQAGFALSLYLLMLN